MKNLKSTPKHTYPKPPARLSAEAKAVWADLHRGWDIDDAGRLVLGCGLEALDRMRQAQADIKKHGVMFTDMFGQLRTNPATITERDSRSSWLAALKQLGLDLEPLHDRPGRPVK
jgi:P27 family predicted phage terminase small subunit